MQSKFKTKDNNNKDRWFRVSYNDTSAPHMHLKTATHITSSYWSKMQRKTTTARWQLEYWFEEVRKVLILVRIKCSEKVSVRSFRTDPTEFLCVLWSVNERSGFTSTLRNWRHVILQRNHQNKHNNKSWKQNPVICSLPSVVAGCFANVLLLIRVFCREAWSALKRRVIYVIHDVCLRARFGCFICSVIRRQPHVLEWFWN